MGTDAIRQRYQVGRAPVNFHWGTVKLLLDVATACTEYQDQTLRGLHCKRLQCDEIWSFIYAKEKNVPGDKRGTFDFGDVWTWTALCADCKLVPSWLVAKRDAGSAFHFVGDLAGRLASRVQMTTDGNRVYLEAVEAAFGSEIDYAMLVKLYGTDPAADQTRYSPAKCIGTVQQRITGNPDPAHVSTSFVERQNLTMRMSMRRFTRLTNAFSKKVANHAAAVAFYFMWYNFARIHQNAPGHPGHGGGSGGSRLVGGRDRRACSIVQGPGKSMIWWQQRNGHKGLTGVGLLLTIVWAVWAIGLGGFWTGDHPRLHLFLYVGLLAMVVGLFTWPEPPGPPSN